MRALIVIAFICSFSSFGQNRKFLIDFNQSERFLHADAEASEHRVDIKNFDASQMSAMFLKKVDEELSKKLRPALTQDSILNQMAHSAIKFVARKTYKDRQKWRKEKRSFEYALKLSASKYRMLEAYRYQIDLLDYIAGGRFYFDRRIQTSSLNLYAGRPVKIKDPEHEDYVEPVPLEPKTEQAVVDLLLKKLESRGAWRDILSRKYYRIGVATKLEVKSMNRSKRPFIYVIILIAGKQNVLLKKKDYTERILRYEVDEL